MSYDYDALVTKALACRRNAIIGSKDMNNSGGGGNDCCGVDETDESESVEQGANLSSKKTEFLHDAMSTFGELSQHCPMTPLIWIQYGATAFDYGQSLAKDSANEDSVENSFDPATTAADSMETEIQILQLGLQQFPGSLILHLRHVYLIHQMQKLRQQFPQPQGKQELSLALEQAIAFVGCGSYASDGPLVVSHLYKPLAELYASQGRGDDLFRLLVSEQARRPVPSDEVLRLFKTLCKEYGLSPTTAQHTSPDQIIDESRRLVAKLYSGLIQVQHFEVEIQSFLHAHNMLPPWQLLGENDYVSDASTEHNNDAFAHFWNEILMKSDGKALKFGMGYGGMELAQMFVSFAASLAEFQDPGMEDQDENDKSKWNQMVRDTTDLSLAIYERGVAECPTVELMWLSYLDHVESLVRKLHDQKDAGDAQSVVSKSPQQLTTVSQRACRNCPYSLPLAERQLHIQGLLAEYNFIVMDPDKLLVEIAQPALGSKFLPSEHATGTLYLAVLRIIQRRILSLLVSHLPTEVASFDMALDPAKRDKLKCIDSSEPLADDVWTEIQDLCQDWIEMCTTMEEELAKVNTKSAAFTRSILIEQRAASMEHVVQPLITVPSVPNTAIASSDREDEILRLWQKAAKLQNPSHPDTQLLYIRHFFLRTSAIVPISNPVDVAIRLCHVRFLFQKAVTLSGTTSISNPLLLRNHQTAFRQLADEWVQFEAQFGSRKSAQEAQKMVQRKIDKFHASGLSGQISGEKLGTKRITNQTKNISNDDQSQQRSQKDKMDMTFSGGKRPTADTPLQETGDCTEQILKKPRFSKAEEHATTNTNENDSAREAQILDQARSGSDSPDMENAQDTTTPLNRLVVKVGKLEYPAHPYTVRVFNLGEDVEDMDLVDVFQNSKSSCGRLVHARIVREKTGKSKGWGLVQFEEREGVDKALQLDGNIGIRERLISVQRSHTPAVPSIVPSGMHRVNPQGQGKVSKRNMKRRAAQRDSQEESLAGSESAGVQEKQQKYTTLDLIPRGIRKALH
ncbi:hypothetical protein ACA910_004880 [Epithemia clementina (nom. ined.)]